IHYYRNEKGDIQRWAENQTFIALGQILLAAGIEGVDATPIGGFNEEIISEELQLAEQGLIPSVLLTLGYRSENDFNAKLPKSCLIAEATLTTVLGIYPMIVVKRSLPCQFQLIFCFFLFPI